MPTGYDGTYTVASVTSERVLTVIAQITLGATTAEFTDQPQVSLYQWNGATVRSGIFDDQNGIFWEYDGQNTNAVQRTATRQLAGTVTVTPTLTQSQVLAQDLENRLKQVTEL